MTQPNILIVMVDGLTGGLFPDGPLPSLRAPNLRRLADHALRFSRCHAASPLALAAHVALLTGCQPRRTGVHQDGDHVRPDMPTYAHHLRRAGYYVAFVGQHPALRPGQLCGFEDWLCPPGPAPDDAIADVTVRILHALAEHEDAPPWCLTIAFDTPGADLAATIAPETMEKIDTHIGAIFSAIDDTQQEAIVVFVAGHAATPGDHPLSEATTRVPLLISAPGLDPSLIRDPVSTTDLCATLCALAGLDLEQVMPWTDGENLLPMASGGRHGMVYLEHAGTDTAPPMVALRQGAWRFIRGGGEPDLLFDLAADPDQTTNLISDPRAEAILAHFRAAADTTWDMAAFHAQLTVARARSTLIAQALQNGIPADGPDA